MKTAIMLHGKPSYEEYCNPRAAAARGWRRCHFGLRVAINNHRAWRSDLDLLVREIVRLGRLIDTSR
ncbi:MAG: hypothetical protein WA579_03020 [Rhodomicrobium sp.]